MKIKENPIKSNLIEVEIETEVKRVYKGIKRILLENILRESIFKVEGIYSPYFSVKPTKFKKGLFSKYKILDPGKKAEEIGQWIIANNYIGYTYIPKSKYKFMPNEGETHPTLNGKLTLYGLLIKKQ